MEKRKFLKGLLAGAGTLAVMPSIQIATKAKKNYKFEELFSVHSGNERLIYPKPESYIYSKIKSFFSDRIDFSKPHIFLPVHQLSMPVKDVYTWDDFLCIKYYFESIYHRDTFFTSDGSGVCYRFIMDKPDRMHLDVFLVR